MKIISSEFQFNFLQTADHTQTRATPIGEDIQNCKKVYQKKEKRKICIFLPPKSPSRSKNFPNSSLVFISVCNCWTDPFLVIFTNNHKFTRDTANTKVNSYRGY